MAYQLKPLEFVFEITERETGATQTITTTPSMWAKADDYKDALMARGNHTPAWCLVRFVNYMAMQAAERAGMIGRLSGVPSVEEQAEFCSRFECADVSRDYPREQVEGGDDKNPTTAGREEGRGAE